MIEILVVIYWLIGMGGLYYFWSKDPIMKNGSVIIKYIFVFMAGVTGPFSWPIGYYIHRKI